MKKELLALSLLIAATSANAANVFEQPLSGSGTLHASSWVTPDGSDSDVFAYDNFTLGTATSISEVKWRGGYAYNAPYGRVSNFRIMFYPTILAGTEPDVTRPLATYFASNNGSETYFGNVGGRDIYSYRLALKTPFDAKANTKYWIQIQAYQPGFCDWGLADASGGDRQHFAFVYGWHRYLFYTGDTSFALFSADGNTFAINGSASPAVAGTVSGSGNYALNAPVTLSAVPEPGFTFVNWTENGLRVSTTAQYSFAATANRSLVANLVPTLVSLKPLKTKFVGGTLNTATINLGVAAPDTTPVTLTSSMPAALGVPTPVYVLAGDTSATFEFSAMPWNTDYQVKVTAQLGPIKKAFYVVVKAPSPSTVKTSPTILRGGGSSTLTVTLNGPAPTTGYQVTLASSDPAVAVPASIWFNAGATTASCTIKTNPVLVQTLVTITATANGIAKSRLMTINP